MTDAAKDTFEKLKELAEKNKFGVCPTCGQCPTCGRHASPWQPYPVYPQWPNNPWRPYYVGDAPDWCGPQVTCGGAQ